MWKWHHLTVQIKRVREEQQLTEAFAKSKEFEQYLSLMNNTLWQAQESLLTDLPEVYPTVHIVGAPRSGTTLVSQMLSSFLDVGYINNLIAAFWKAPLFGIQLSKKLLGTDYHSDFSSVYGRTSGILEPHEFGYFWNYNLKYPDFQQRTEQQLDIDWKQLSGLLKNMTDAFGKPILFKSFLLGFHATQMYHQLPKTCYIYVKRDFLENAFSILKLRQNMLGDDTKWASIRPKQYEWLQHENKFVQIAGQILFLEHEYLTELAHVPDTNVMYWSYRDVCDNPNVFVSKTQEMLNRQGASVQLLSQRDITFSASARPIPKDIEQAFLKAYDFIRNHHTELLIL